MGARHRILVGVRSRFIEFRMGLRQDIGFGLGLDQNPYDFGWD